MLKTTKICIVLAALVLSACSNDNDKFIGTWQDTQESDTKFTISKAENGLVLQAYGESTTVAVIVNGDNLKVENTEFTYEPQKKSLTLPGLFNSKVEFIKLGDATK